MLKESKGIRLEHISKIYQDPKTGKDFKAVDDANLVIEPGFEGVWENLTPVRKLYVIDLGEGGSE